MAPLPRRTRYERVGDRLVPILPGHQDHMPRQGRSIAQSCEERVAVWIAEPDPGEDGGQPVERCGFLGRRVDGCHPHSGLTCG